jgi:hypothetical protein
VDDIKLNLGAMDWGAVDWIGLGQDGKKLRALVTVIMNLQVQ